MPMKKLIFCHLGPKKLIQEQILEFWEGLGKVLEGFGEILGKAWGDFWKDRYGQRIHA